MGNDILHLPIIQRKKLVKSGASLVISIPKAWLLANGIKSGDEVIMIANVDSVTLSKLNEENVKKMNEVISRIKEGIAK